MAVTRPTIDRPAGLSRFEFTAMISMLMASAALSIDLMLPAFGRIRADFGLPEDSTRVGAIITSFFLGFALAQILYGPLADRFGGSPPSTSDWPSTCSARSAQRSRPRWGGWW